VDGLDYAIVTNNIGNLDDIHWQVIERFA